MKLHCRLRRNNAFSSIALVIAYGFLAGLFAPGATPLFYSECTAAENADEAPAAPDGASSIENGIARVKKHLSLCKLQDARRELEAVKGALARESGRIGQTQAAPYQAAIAKCKNAIDAKEDSLVNRNLEILRVKGADSAFQFMQDEAWAHGVSREKIDFLENAILNQETVRQQAREREDVARAVRLIESRAPMDTAIDPYIVKTAQMMVKAQGGKAAKSEEALEAETTAPRTESQTPVQAPAPIQPVPEETPRVEAPVEDVIRTPEEKPIRPEPQTPPATVFTLPPEPEEVTPPPPPPKVTTPKPRPKAKASAAEEYTSPSLQAELQARAKAKQEFLRRLRLKQEEAQNEVMNLYTMMENGQGPGALARFRQRRALIAGHVDAQVFNVLEQTLVQGAMEKHSTASSHARKDSEPKSPEQASLDRIDGLLRDNRVEAAYAEFKRMEPRFKQYMSKKDFKMTKSMVEDAYKLRNRN